MKSYDFQHIRVGLNFDIEILASIRPSSLSELELGHVRGESVLNADQAAVNNTCLVNQGSIWGGEVVGAGAPFAIPDLLGLSDICAYYFET